MTDDLSKSVTVVKDPVCGMTVNPATAKHRFEHAGKSHYFCSGGCAEKFKADPEKYLTHSARPHSSSQVTLGKPTIRPAPAPASTLSANQANYVCPMCPQVRASKPGPSLQVKKRIPNSAT